MSEFRVNLQVASAVLLAVFLIGCSDSDTPMAATTAVPVVSLEEYLMLCGGSYDVEVSTNKEMSDWITRFLAELEPVTPPPEVAAWHNQLLSSLRAARAVIDVQPPDEEVSFASAILIAAAMMEAMEEAANLPAEVRSKLEEAGCIEEEGEIEGDVHVEPRVTLVELRVILEEHEGAVASVAFSPDSRTLASGSGGFFANSGIGDETIRLWDVATGEAKAILQGHTSGVRSVSFSPDGTTLASGSSDQTIRLWDVASGQEKAVLQSHTGRVTSVSFSPDGLTLASGGFWGDIHLWDVASGQEKAVLEGPSGGVTSVSFSPDGQTLAIGGGSSGNPAVELWDVIGGQKKAALQGHGNFVTAVVFSPDGQSLASSGADNTVRLWDAANGQQEAEFVSPSNGSLSSVSFSPDGATLAVAAHDGRVWLWDVSSGQESSPGRHRSDVLSVSFSPDGRTLASGSADKTIRLWDVTTE